jgi:hypothetical protein
VLHGLWRKDGLRDGALIQYDAAMGLAIKRDGHFIKGNVVI